LRTPLAALRNEGPGFAPELVEHALEPFTRGDPARLGPGAGLGLAIVDVIARAHGGAAHAANRDGGADAWLAPGPPRAHTACCGDNSPLSRPESVKGLSTKAADGYSMNA